ncbi:hypothetical protein H6G17_06875 [Chroococcidiopsis sp. FACHB-1243]|uniref:hypothetical protein n=1 Tax=Chroococcidiopsis sp. [FACHB-1243] TaxID=2692781 RepID=UPI00177E367E|nr:hypothetical protein [Chroococcidiopsis sp. [FACHB-1243]]MBD2305235.1 hypothetical protein [Chroococcidiopsis sp. [FACHB-1243]]
MSKILSFVLLGGFLSSVGFGIFQMIKGVANMLFNLAYRHRYPIGEVNISYGDDFSHDGSNANFDCHSFEALGIDLGGLCDGGGGDGS